MLLFFTKKVILIRIQVYRESWEDNVSVESLNDANFEEKVIKAERPVFVDFWAQWCGPCRMIGPVVESLSDDYSSKMDFYKVDVDSQSKLAREYDITSIPALFIFKNGQVVKKMVGAYSKEALEQEINSFIQN